MDSAAFALLSPCSFADVLSHDRVMDHGIRPLYPDMPRVAGPAYPVECPPGDNLMLHAALHRAPAGAVLVCKAGDSEWAMAGGNVCAFAKQRGLAGLVVDGVVRDLAEIRALRFPVLARGVVPIPGVKKKLGTIDGPIVCGGVQVEPGDLVIGDEEGVVVVPAARAREVLAAAQARAAKDEAMPLAAWVESHRKSVDAALRELGFPA